MECIKILSYKLIKIIINILNSSPRTQWGGDYIKYNNKLCSRSFFDLLLPSSVLNTVGYPPVTNRNWYGCSVPVPREVF